MTRTSNWLPASPQPQERINRAFELPHLNQQARRGRGPGESVGLFRAINRHLTHGNRAARQISVLGLGATEVARAVT
jgi:hypothetical protein